MSSSLAEAVPASSIPVDHESLVRDVQAAAFLGLKPQTLRQWRLERRGPAFIRAGRAIRYRRRDLVAWADANLEKVSGQ